MHEDCRLALFTTFCCYAMEVSKLVRMYFEKKLYYLYVYVSLTGNYTDQFHLLTYYFFPRHIFLSNKKKVLSRYTEMIIYLSVFPSYLPLKLFVKTNSASSRFSLSIAVSKSNTVRPSNLESLSKCLKLLPSYFCRESIYCRVHNNIIHFQKFQLYPFGFIKKGVSLIL